MFWLGKIFLKDTHKSFLTHLLILILVNYKIMIELYLYKKEVILILDPTLTKLLDATPPVMHLECSHGITFQTCDSNDAHDGDYTFTKKIN